MRRSNSLRWLIPGGRETATRAAVAALMALALAALAGAEARAQIQASYGGSPK